VIAYAHSRGVVVVAASGNSYAPAAWHHPAHSPHVITVGAIDYKNDHAEFYNFGPGLDVVAPGVGVLSLLSSQWCRRDLQLEPKLRR
jgi:serine protease